MDEGKRKARQKWRAMIGCDPSLWVKVNLSPITSPRCGAFIFPFEVKAFEFGMCQPFWTVRSNIYCSKCRVVTPLPALADGAPVLVGVKGFASRQTAADP